jgi:hypothetical protein
MSKNGLAALDAHIERLRKLPDLVRSAAPEVAEAVEAELQKSIAAGTSADGKVWTPRKDGGQPLKTAGKSLAVVAVGTTVFGRLRGHVARHHRGIAKGGIQRRIFPSTGKLPPAMSKAIRDVFVRRFQSEFGHG